MIKKLQHKDIGIAKVVRSVFQASYKVEAKLLNATDFPPLKRPLENYINSRTEFFGYFKNEAIVAVVEIDQNTDFTLIRSLVVLPLYFRQGIATALMEFVLNKFDTDLFVVETGVENGPATKLYEQFGFVEEEQWDTDHGVRKVRFERRKETK